MALNREIERNIMRAGREGDRRQLKLALMLRDYINQLIRDEGFVDYPPKVISITENNTEIILDEETGIVRVGNRNAKLAPKEYNLMELFLNNRGRTLTHKDISKNVLDEESNPQYVAVLIKRLRERIEENPDIPRFIRTVRGEGYVFGIETEN